MFKWWNKNCWWSHNWEDWGPMLEILVKVEFNGKLVNGVKRIQTRTCKSCNETEENRLW